MNEVDDNQAKKQPGQTTIYTGRGVKLKIATVALEYIWCGTFGSKLLRLLQGTYSVPYHNESFFCSTRLLFPRKHDTVVNSKLNLDGDSVELQRS